MGTEGKLKPAAQTEHGKVYQGDVLDVLRRLRKRSIHMICTSPPYWGLRDYKTGTWEGGNDPQCDHKRFKTDARIDQTSTLNSRATNQNHEREPWPNGICRKCGAKRIDRQIGSEKIMDCGGWTRGECCAEKDWDTACFVCRMVLVFRECRRVLRDDGCIFMNLGDTYGQPGRWGGKLKTKCKQQTNIGTHSQHLKDNPISGLPSGNLCGVPWRVALALQADHWILRQDIIWQKPAPMPEPTTSRCTKSHEYIFMLAKSMKYYFDNEAIKEKAISKPHAMGNRRAPESGFSGANNVGDPDRVVNYTMSNKRSVWTISHENFKGAHFAVFPRKLPDLCLRAGTSQKGCCAECGAPWRRKVKKKRIKTRPGTNSKVSVPTGCPTGRNTPHTSVAHQTERGRRDAKETGNRDEYRYCTITKTVGWEPSCTCHGKFVKRRIKTVFHGDWNDRDTGDPKVAWKNRDPKPKIKKKMVEEYVSDLPLNEHPIVPCTVLDIYAGSGTTIEAAIRRGRIGIGIELNPEYIKFCKRRMERAERKLGFLAMVK